MTKLLYIDTTSSPSVLLLMNELEILSCKKNVDQTKHGQVVHTQIQEMLLETDTSWNELGAICVLNGPGSYTGLRISLATAKGFCYVKDLPLILLNKLDLIGSIAVNTVSNETICSVIKAREAEYFAAFYASSLERIIDPQLFTEVELIKQITLRNAQVCSINELDYAVFNSHKVLEVREEDILSLCFSSYKQQLFADIFLSEPFYLKNVHINKINKL